MHITRKVAAEIDAEGLELLQSAVSLWGFMRNDMRLSEDERRAAEKRYQQGTDYLNKTQSSVKTAMSVSQEDAYKLGLEAGTQVAEAVQESNQDKTLSPDIWMEQAIEAEAEARPPLMEDMGAGGDPSSIESESQGLEVLHAYDRGVSDGIWAVVNKADKPVTATVHPDLVKSFMDHPENFGVPKDRAESMSYGDISDFLASRGLERSGAKKNGGDVKKGNIVTDMNLAENMFGKIKGDIRRRLLDYLENPTVDIWDDVQGIILNDKYETVWQAVLAVDPSFPTQGRTTDLHGKVVEDWPKIPDVETFKEAIYYATH